MKELSITGADQERHRGISPPTTLGFAAGWFFFDSSEVQEKNQRHIGRLCDLVSEQAGPILGPSVPGYGKIAKERRTQVLLSVSPEHLGG